MNRRNGGRIVGAYVTRAALNSYLETAIWSSLNWDDMDDRDNPGNFDEFNISDFSSEAVAEAKADLEKFYDIAGELLDGFDDEHIGHDFWLTRNNHGAGFWDGDYEPYGDELTDISHQFPERSVWLDPETDELNFDIG